MRLAVPIGAAEAADAARFGAKAARLAALGHAGLPIPAGWCLDAEAYRLQLAHLGLQDASRAAFGAEERPRARREALGLRLALMERPLAAPVAALLREIWNAVGKPCVARSSALVEDRAGSSFAGQFQSYLGLDAPEDFLTAVRACWAALWTPRALRYMAAQQRDASETAMAVLVQPLVAARAAGGGLSRTAEGGMVVNATPGLGAGLAQGEVVPERYALSPSGAITESSRGARYHGLGCAHGRRALARMLVAPPCLDAGQVAELGVLMRGAEQVVGGPVEIEWALDEKGIKLLQARPLSLASAPVADEIWLRRPKLSGHPGGAGWATGPARIVNCECGLDRVAPGDVLVTTVAGPSLAEVLSRVAGVVTELGGSTSHLASLARERGMPMVLGVPEATRRIPDGAACAVDGVAGVVRWMRP